MRGSFHYCHTLAGAASEMTMRRPSLVWSHPCRRRVRNGDGQTVISVVIPSRLVPHPFSVVIPGPAQPEPGIQFVGASLQVESQRVTGFVLPRSGSSVSPRPFAAETI